MKFKYSGQLITQFPPSKLGPLATEEAIKAEEAQRLLAKFKKMDLLFDAHRVRPHDWMGLCFALAEAHVPGFRVARRPVGAPTEWTALRRAELYLDVEKTGLPVSAACRGLINYEPWKSLIPKARGAARLRDEYYKADQRMVKVLRSARAYDALVPDSAPLAEKQSREY